MFVYCKKCGYDSGDRDSNEELAAKVRADGGGMMQTYDENGKPRGLEIVCPNCQDGDEVGID